MNLAKRWRTGAPVCALLVCSALGACAPGPEEARAGADSPDESRDPTTVIDTPAVGNALPTVEPLSPPAAQSSAGEPDEIPVSPTAPVPAGMPVSVPPVSVVDLPDDVAPPENVSEEILPEETPAPATVPEPDSTIVTEVDTTPDTALDAEPVAVFEPDTDPAAEADPADGSPDTNPEEETPSTNPFDVADEPLPGTDHEEVPEAGAAPGTGAEGGESTPTNSDSGEGQDGRPTHDPDGTPYCD